MPARAPTPRAMRCASGFNQALEAADVPWAAYGTFSGLHLFTNAQGRALRPSEFDPLAVPYAELKARAGQHHPSPAASRCWSRASTSTTGRARRPRRRWRAGPRRHDRRLRRGAPPAQARRRPLADCSVAAESLTAARDCAATDTCRSPTGAIIRSLQNLQQFPRFLQVGSFEMARERVRYRGEEIMSPSTVALLGP